MTDNAATYAPTRKLQTRDSDNAHAAGDGIAQIPEDQRCLVTCEAYSYLDGFRDKELISGVTDQTGTPAQVRKVNDIRRDTIFRSSLANNVNTSRETVRAKRAAYAVCYYRQPHTAEAVPPIWTCCASIRRLSRRWMPANKWKPIRTPH